MRFSHFVSLLLVIFSPSAFAQETDSLVLFGEIKFSSDFERQVFRDARKGKADLFSLFIANGNLLTDAKIADSRTKFYEYVNSLNVDDIKKNEKRIKYVYDNIEKKYLKKFEVKSRFEEIFYNGYFNSISASAVFALALDKLKIPYSIKEEAVRVYLIAYPLGEKIVINSLPEMGGYFEISDSFKESYLKRLKDQKMIPESEYNASSLKDLFDKYYFDQGADVTPVQLASIQYVNEALFLSGQKKEDVAYSLVQKAYTLNPSDRYAYLLMVTSAAAFEAHKTRDSVQAVQLAQLSRYIRFGIDREGIISEFGIVIQKLLFEENARAKFEMYFRVLNKNLRDRQIIDEITFLYNFHYGRYYYSQGRYAEALPFLEKTMDLKPVDVDTQTLFLSSFGNAYKNYPGTEIAPKLEAYDKRYASLKENNNFTMMMASVYLGEFYQNYLLGKAADGDKYKALFEKLMTAHPDAPVNPNMIGQAYSEAAVYYYRKGQVAKAKQIIATGLKYAPNSYELKSRQSMIK